MKLQQLRFLVAVAQHELNLTTAAAKLGTTQPAVSKQLKLLEAELGFNLFVRDGRAFTRITPGGERVLQHALRVVQEARNIRSMSDEIRNSHSGVLTIGTTHTQARYVLPATFQRFRADYPQVEFHLRQGTSEQIAEMARLDYIDFGIATGSRELFDGFVLLPCYQWRQRLIVPRDHPLAQGPRPSLEQLAAAPLITYGLGFSGAFSLHEAFARAHLRPNIVLTAHDSDVIKTYVRLGLGVGVVADVALEPKDARDLAAIDVPHLFPALTTWVGFRRGALLRSYMYDFLRLLAPHLTRKLINDAQRCRTQQEIDALVDSSGITIGSVSPGDRGVMRARQATLGSGRGAPQATGS